VIPLAPVSPHGYPAPFWLLEALKVFGFSLHMSMMNLWYAGMPLAFLLALVGGAHGRHLAARIGRAMPIAVALGVNFGIIPLLFTQVVDYQFFYPAGVMMAWPWLSVIALLIVAYYGVYIHAQSKRRVLAVAAAGVSGFLLVVIGFLFANNFSLMTNPDQWVAIFKRTAETGSPTGLALNLGDPTLFPRWLMMFGLAITTTAAFIALNTVLSASPGPPEYTTWARRLALALYSIGLVWFAAAGSWYVFGTFPHRVHQAILVDRWVTALMVLTAIAPGLPWLLLLLWQRFASGLLVGAAAVAQFGVLAINAISRQWVQNVEVRPYADLAATPVHTQLGGLILFLLMFAAAAVFCIWLGLKLRAALVAQAAQAAP
jgi:hypothetical protein